MLQLPGVEEIDALLNSKPMTAIVFFLDETFEELSYDITTTVLEAVEQLANIIKLQNYQTFTLYECRKVGRSVLSQPGPGAHSRQCRSKVQLGGLRYRGGDAKQASSREHHARLGSHICLQLQPCRHACLRCTLIVSCQVACRDAQKFKFWVRLNLHLVHRG